MEFLICAIILAVMLAAMLACAWLMRESAGMKDDEDD
jgi:hypothetical protein